MFGFKRSLVSVVAMTLLLVASNGEASQKANNMLINGALTGNSKLVSKAIKSGADVNSKEPAKGNTALMLAAYYKHHKIVDMLIKSKADNDGYTALMNAQDQKHKHIVEYLKKVSGSD